MSTIEFEGVNLGLPPDQFLHKLIVMLRQPGVASVNIALEEYKLDVEPVMIRDEPVISEAAPATPKASLGKVSGKGTVRDRAR